MKRKREKKKKKCGDGGSGKNSKRVSEWNILFRAIGQSGFFVPERISGRQLSAGNGSRPYQEPALSDGSRDDHRLCRCYITRFLSFSFVESSCLQFRLMIAEFLPTMSLSRCGRQASRLIPRSGSSPRATTAITTARRPSFQLQTPSAAFRNLQWRSVSSSSRDGQQHVRSI